MSEMKWQPIETLAPKDGDEFMVSNNRGMFVAMWEDGWMSRPDEDHPNLGYGWFMISDGKDIERPLRGDVPQWWRPLPTPPEGTQA